ncbi:EamA family transporter [candidate division KSB3 bacterium]|uniref:EamA family transporter n=1 Tax=candidate division KSB3 bacterium TaxID=2044937 RepID=A0A2G6KH16_9BACT|nr:MAG: EamA family transporter [candidate division KSB3 bacterium]
MSEWLGYLQTLLAATCWAVAGTVAKHMMNQDLSPVVLAEMRVTIASALLLLVLSFKNRELLRIRPGDLFYMIVLGAIGVAGVHYTYYYAISHTNVATAILLQYLAPAFILMFAVVVQGEACSAGKICALCLASLGCFLMVGGYDLELLAMNRLGVLAGLVSAGFFAFYSIYAEYGMRRYSVWTILVYGFASAAAFWWCLNPPWNILRAQYSAQIWLMFLFLGVFSAIVPFALYFSGIRRIKATRASITAMAEPVVGGIVAYLFLEETMTLIQLLGAGCVMGGILCLQVFRERRTRG